MLDHVRDNTFHYPSPDPTYNPTSDEQLRDALAAMADTCAEVFADFVKRQVTLTFADNLAMALALGKHATNEEDLRRQLTIARDGAIAFRAWAEALGVAYFNANGPRLRHAGAEEQPASVSRELETTRTRARGLLQGYGFRKCGSGEGDAE